MGGDISEKNFQIILAFLLMGPGKREPLLS
jgi:hypothetical protein